MDTSWGTTDRSAGERGAGMPRTRGVWPTLRHGGAQQATVSRALPVTTDPDLPERADAVIVGAGIAGICTALELAARGLSVLVCEKGVVAGEQSSRAFGWVTSHEQAPGMLPLVNLSKQLWAGMNEALGADTSYRGEGLLQLCASDEEVAVNEAWLQAARAVGPTDAHMISGAKLAALLPGGSTRQWKAALHQPSDGGVDPPAATSVLARVARARGVRIVAGCAVRSIETQAGAVSAVVTERGAVRTSRVVVAGGAWSRLFLGNAGQNLPTLNVNLSMQRLSAVPGPVGCGGLLETGWRREVGGTYSLGAAVLTGPITLDSFLLFKAFKPVVDTMGDRFNVTLNADFFRSLWQARRWRADQVSPFERHRIVSPPPDEALLDRALLHLCEELPVFRQGHVIERWGGCLTVTPDFNPVISAVAAMPGLFLNTAHAFGLTTGPAAGRLLAELITGAPPSVDATPFDLARFAPQGRA